MNLQLTTTVGLLLGIGWILYHPLSFLINGAQASEDCKMDDSILDKLYVVYPTWRIITVLHIILGCLIMTIRRLQRLQIGSFIHQEAIRVLTILKAALFLLGYSYIGIAGSVAHMNFLTDKNIPEECIKMHMTAASNLFLLYLAVYFFIPFSMNLKYPFNTGLRAWKYFITLMWFFGGFSDVEEILANFDEEDSVEDLSDKEDGETPVSSNVNSKSIIDKKCIEYGPLYPASCDEYHHWEHQNYHYWEHQKYLKKQELDREERRTDMGMCHPVRRNGTLTWRC
ncbi:hypothetical protein B9Z55_024747 [Caenorhabditis nigoni]|uniref:Uncharacterized protein n=1 Tax=Caenorhabditis nigoni TaxID=1611254 RepID=A0A2G5SVV3_9PELO|nr:hypothetical protein B9Z55_024747 [Caenorhabditis nigoni]